MSIVAQLNAELGVELSADQWRTAALIAQDQAQLQSLGQLIALARSRSEEILGPQRAALETARVELEQLEAQHRDVLAALATLSEQLAAGQAVTLPTTEGIEADLAAQQ
jgi:hypothetical protein